MESDFIILRPNQRTARFQLRALIGVAVTSLVLAIGTSDPTAIAVTAAISTLGVGATAWYYRDWMRYHAPTAIVATPDYIAVLHRTGTRAYVPWASIAAANHATTLSGMRWYLDATAGALRVHDIGIHADRWGVLWRVVWQEVARRGAPVHVDAMSNALFD